MSNEKRWRQYDNRRARYGSRAEYKKAQRLRRAIRKWRGTLASIRHRVRSYDGSVTLLEQLRKLKGGEGAF